MAAARAMGAIGRAQPVIRQEAAEVIIRPAANKTNAVEREWQHSLSKRPPVFHPEWKVVFGRAALHRVEGIGTLGDHAFKHFGSEFFIRGL